MKELHEVNLTLLNIKICMVYLNLNLNNTFIKKTIKQNVIFEFYFCIILLLLSPHLDYLQENHHHISIFERLFWSNVRILSSTVILYFITQSCTVLPAKVDWLLNMF